MEFCFCLKFHESYSVSVHEWLWTRFILCMFAALCCCFCLLHACVYIGKWGVYGCGWALGIRQAWWVCPVWKLATPEADEYTHLQLMKPCQGSYLRVWLSAPQRGIIVWDATLVLKLSKVSMRMHAAVLCLNGCFCFPRRRVEHQTAARTGSAETPERRAQRQRLFGEDTTRK